MTLFHQQKPHHVTKIVELNSSPCWNLLSHLNDKSKEYERFVITHFTHFLPKYRSSKSLIQIGYQISNIFQSDWQPDQGIGDTKGSSFFRAYRCVSH